MSKWGGYGSVRPVLIIRTNIGGREKSYENTSKTSSDYRAFSEFMLK
jgi:hypothetical protein